MAAYSALASRPDRVRTSRVEKAGPLLASARPPDVTPSSLSDSEPDLYLAFSSRVRERVAAGRSLHGKEGVDGSSPEEGLPSSCDLRPQPQRALFL
jgi:hypothetical protein